MVGVAAGHRRDEALVHQLAVCDLVALERERRLGRQQVVRDPGACGRSSDMSGKLPGMARTLTQRELNRALLARQGLLERRALSLPDALDAMGALQAQYAPSMYIGLWSRVAGFERDALTRALERREVVQATLMRVHDPPRLARGLLAAGDRDPRRAARLVAARDQAAGAGSRRGRDAARGAARRAAEAQGDRGADRQGRRARRRDVARPRARAAVGHVGAPPRRPLRAGRGLARAARRRRRRRARPPRHALPDRLRARAPRPTSPTGPGWRRATSSRRWSGSSCGASGRGRHRAVRPARTRRCRTPTRRRRCASCRTWDAALLVHARRTQILPEEHRAADLQHEDAAVGRHVPRRRRGRGRVAARTATIEPFEPLTARAAARGRRRGRAAGRVLRLTLYFGLACTTARSSSSPRRPTRTRPTCCSCPRRPRPTGRRSSRTPRSGGSAQGSRSSRPASRTARSTC